MGLQLPMNSLFGMAIQQGAGANDHAKMAAGYEQLNSTDNQFRWFILTDYALAPVKNQANLPPEINPRALSAGTYVTGVWAQGPVSMIPRLSDQFGWLMLAAMGHVSTVSDTTAANVFGVQGGDAGINSHLFTFYDDDQYFQPWLTLRRLLPHTTAAEVLGAIFQDGRIASMTLNAAAASPVTADINFLARVNQSNYVFNPAPGWTESYDDLYDFGVTSCDGYFRVGGVNFPVTTMSLTLANSLLQPQQSITIGTVHPEDFPNLGRTAQFTATFLVEDYDLYASIFAGTAVDFDGSSGENVACQVYDADLDVMLASQTYISGTEPYKLRIVSNTTGDDNVTWSVAPIRIQPNQPIVMQVTGDIKAVGSGFPLYAILQNAQTNYELP
jgi:hypothetical protein